MIKLTHTKANLGDIHISNLYQTPISTFSNFWNGSREDYEEYLKNYNLNANYNVANLEQLHSMASQSFMGFEKSVNRSIGQFNFLLRSALRPRNLPPLELDDYMKLEIDLSEESPETKQAMKEKFISSSSRSFVDFRNIVDDKLIFIYNRRGMMNEGERIAICKAKPSITLKDNFKAAKDNNFIISGLLKDIAIRNTTFSFSYVAGNDTKELRAESNEILDIAKFKEESNINIAISQDNINIIETAKKEIKEEQNQARQSLKADSTYQEITKEASSQIELKESIDSTISDYEAKELEKLKIRLSKSKELAIDIYKELRAKIEDNNGILESLNILKQKYREEHAVNLASIYLGKDLLDVVQKDNLISDLENIIKQKQAELNSKDIEISKREDTLYSLRSTLSQKENDISLLKEEMENTINDLETQTKITIQELKTSFEEQKDLLEKDLMESDELISRQKEEINFKDRNINDLKATLDSTSKENIALIEHNQELKTTNKTLLDKVEIAEKELRILKELQEANEKLVIENKSLYEQKDLLNVNINDLKATLQELKEKNQALEDKINSMQNDYKDIVNKLVAQKDEVIAKNNSLQEKIEQKGQNKEKQQPTSNVKEILERKNNARKQ